VRHHPQLKSTILVVAFLRIGVVRWTPSLDVREQHRATLGVPVSNLLQLDHAGTTALGGVYFAQYRLSRLV
jgi:hypothetical protein